MSKQPPPAPTASAVGPCPTVIQIVGRPGTGSLPSTIATPDHPLQTSLSLIMRSNVLQMQLVKAVGRYLFGSVLSLPGLGIGIIVASFQDFGTLPVSQMSLRGWSGGAMVLGKLPVPRRPTHLD